jgi:hypothetical protein
MERAMKLPHGLKSMLNQQSSTSPVGILAYENWRAALDGVPAGDAWEYPLFSDGELINEISEGLGPYQIFTAASNQDAGTNAVRAFLRSTYHPRPDTPRPGDSTSEHYHGGVTQDEIAALLSLCLGIRLKAGESTRLFQQHGDPRGRPHAWKLFTQHDPLLVKSSRAPILPGVIGSRNLADADLLFTLPRMSPAQSVAVSRAARLYQDAVWIAESEPELSWLLLVSAVETAAELWVPEQENAINTLHSMPYGPRVAALLKDAGQERLFPEIAELLAPYSGSTGRFRRFLLNFLPPPPEERPPEHYRISWEEADMKKAFNIIYGHRSKALHGGKPFPSPMCWSPRMAGDAASERLLGTGAGARGATWKSAEMPMLLSTFEYIVRGALKSWWSTLRAS